MTRTRPLVRALAIATAVTVVSVVVPATQRAALGAAAPQCTGSSAKSAKVTTRAIVTTAAEVLSAGRDMATVEGELHRRWCLDQVGTVSFPANKAGEPAALLSGPTTNDDVTWYSGSINYDHASDQYWVIANWKWNNRNYNTESSMNESCLWDTEIGGRDSIGLQLSGGPFEITDTADPNDGPAAMAWGDPQLDGNGMDIGLTDLGRPANESEYGVAWTAQDYVRPTIAWYGCDTTQADYNLFSGVAAMNLRTLNGSCTYAQLFPEYVHTWTSTDITGVTVGSSGLDVTFSTSDDHWAKRSADGTGQICGGTTGGTGGGYELPIPSGCGCDGDTSGSASIGKAEPALAYDQNDGHMTIYRWTSDGSTFNRSTDYQSGSFYLSHVGNRVAAGDVDGDGDDDIVMAYQNNDGTFSLHVFKSGKTWAGVWYTSGSFDLNNVSGRLVVADFNGDGKAEPAMAYYNADGTQRIYRWQSTGSSFTRATDYIGTGIFRLSRVGDRMAAADVTGDGRADIVMAYQNADNTFSYYVWKDGLTSLGVWYTSGSFNLDNVSGRLVVADFNGDGKAEPAMAYYNADGTQRIYRWQSTGSSFTRATDYIGTGIFRLSNVEDRMAAADVTGDGRADIVMAYQNADNTFSYYVWKDGLTSLGIWYTSGIYHLDHVQGRMVLGAF